jgi:hypothetical protein
MIAPLEAASHLRFVLSNLKAPELQQICFEFSLHPRIRTEWGQWEEIDSTLGSDAFPLLCSVKIILRLHLSSLLDVNIIRKKFVKHFPSLISRGILDIESEDS